MSHLAAIYGLFPRRINAEFVFHIMYIRRCVVTECKLLFELGIYTGALSLFRWLTFNSFIDIWLFD